MDDIPTPPRPGIVTPPHTGTPSDLGIVDALAQLSFLVQGALARHAAAVDLSMTQTRLLGVLRDRAPTMVELARFLGLDKSSVTGLVDRAGQRGLVRRVPSPEDGRSVRVLLTDAGRAVIGEVATAFERDIAAATACLSPDESRQLSALVTRIVLAYGTPT